MTFELKEALEVLGRTPSTLRSLLADLPEPWIQGNEGPDTWTPYDVVGHLIHGEKTDWIARLRVILEKGPEAMFEPFDRFAQFQASQGKSLGQLLDEFEGLRGENMATLRALDLQRDDLKKKGRHPDFGDVTLEQMLATWVVHDLSHIGQIARTMSKQYSAAVGPWRKYLPILGPGRK